MEHATQLTEQEMQAEKMKQIIEDFAKLPPERQAAIVKGIGDGLAKMIERVSKEFIDQLPALLEQFKSAMDGQDPKTGA